MESKRVFLLSVICTVFICATILFAWQTSLAQQLKTAPAVPEALCIVKEYGGKIAVFLPDATTPSQILPDPYVRDLPETDRTMLQTGISIYSAEQLQRLIEDLCG